ncbi:carcinine hydrolase/isopenicillin-N N-acyltransferase family protein [Ulvibacterium sp.]|uniref:carcinine hydrolase/isopenicillin-N N-acyltransferase family protein n=1 Tax=Ulvibacterium sp. TaxID=2665914 RepID=UPI003BADA1E9
MKRLNLILLTLGILFQQQANACSIFTCSKNGQTLVGANEDEYTSFHYMWFVPATDNKYGAVFFGKNNMQTQAGMNEHGLFFDFAAIPRIESKNREVNFVTTAEILASCKNIEEALEMFKKYTFSAFSSQMLMADASGKSVLINADTIVHKTGDYQITTNFNVCNLQDNNYDCLRYDKIDNALAQTKDISVPFFREILDDVHQEGKVSTQYSNIYDLKNREIHINWFHNYNESIVIDLKEELEKGFRMENLWDLFNEKTFAAMNFQESEDSYYYHLIANEVEQKGVEAGIKMFEQFVNDHPDKAARIKEDFTWIPYSLIAKARVAYDNLSFDYYYIPFLTDYRMIWQSENKMLFQALKILEYIKSNNLNQNGFHFHEMVGYINMVLGKKEVSIKNYQKAIATVEKGSREEIRATKTLKKIKGTKFLPQADENLKYLKQTPPTTTPKVFAPDLISKKGEYEFGSVFNEKGTEFFYAVNVNGKEEIRCSELAASEWSKPKTIFSHELYGYNDPFLSTDEQRLYFISQRSMDGLTKKDDYDIWYANRTENGWSEPMNAGPNINTDADEYYISFTNDGTMYFSSNKNNGNFDIYISEMVDGEFQDPESLGEAINTSHYEADVFVAPDGSYLIFCATRPDGFGQGDFYISFKDTDGTWTKSRNMGDLVNSKGHELCPFVSKDGKFLFYTSNQDIYWVDAKIIGNYRN